jgi:hypothetical protein
VLSRKEGNNGRTLGGGEGLPGRQRHAPVYGIAVMSKPVVNIAASVRQRLLNLARERKEDFGLLLTKYALERLLFRISQSEHKMAFILKGALLFELWTEETHRPTRTQISFPSGAAIPAALKPSSRRFVLYRLWTG